MDENFKKIGAYVDACREEVIYFWQELVNFQGTNEVLVFVPHWVANEKGRFSHFFQNFFIFSILHNITLHLFI